MSGCPNAKKRKARKKRKIKGWSTEEVKNQTRNNMEEDTEEMIEWRSVNQEEMDECWKKLAEKIEEEALCWKGGVYEEAGSTEYVSGGEDCWVRFFALFKECNLERVKSMHEDSIEREEMKRQQRMKIMKDITKKIR